jgi:hypothetical protein
MFFLGSRKSPLGQDDEEWQLACWPWLLSNVVDIDTIRDCPLIVPNDTYFPGTKAKGKERAEHVFRCVAELIGVAAWPFDLVEQEERVNPIVSPTLIVQNTPGSPAGTFQLQSDYRLQVTYSPELVDDPGQLIATFVHEICHALMLTIDRSDPESEPPGGWECEEFATDLLVTLLGFGIFGANAAFQFDQYSDPGTGMGGWSTRRSGYLTEIEWAFALAIYFKITGKPLDEANRWLKPGLFKQLKKCTAYLDKNEALLSWA